MDIITREWNPKPNVRTQAAYRELARWARSSDALRCEDCGRIYTTPTCDTQHLHHQEAHNA